MTQILNEVKRSQSLNKSKGGDKYIWWNRLLGNNRHERRLHQKVSRSVANYNKLNMNKLFKDGILDVNIEVKGETDDYLVRISFAGFLDNFQQIVKDKENIKLNDIIRALTKAFNSDDVFFNCNCPDWCLHPDTKIKLLNGEVYPISDILTKFKNKEELWVCSVDELGDFKPGKVSDVWVSGYTSEMIEVTLDNGEKIITTPNHKYMLRDGSYLEANKLEVGQSLMPLYFKINKKGYEDVKKNSIIYPTIFNSVYKTVSENCLNLEIEEAKIRSGEENIAIHHSDFNKLNNYPSNLKPMGVNEHWKYHYTHLYESGVFDKWQEGGRKYWSTKEAREKQANSMRNTMANYYANETEEQKQSRYSKIYTDQWKRKIGNSNKKIWENYTEEEYENRCLINKQSNIKSKEKRQKKVSESWKNMSEKEYKQRCINDGMGVKRAWKKHPEKFLTEKRVTMYKNKEIQKKRLISRVAGIFQKMIADGVELSEEMYAIYRKKDRGPKWSTYFDSFEECKSILGINHTIIDINYIVYDTEIPVYDLSVDKYNNFYIDAGVILHNCYRQAYWASRNNTIAGDPEVRPSNITNPNDTKGGMCKHVAMVMSNNSWIMKVASVIRNYVMYMKQKMPDLYYKVIYPALYGEEYSEEEQQMDIYDVTGEEPELDTSEDELDTTNKWAKTKSQFKPGNKYRIKPNRDSDEIEGQKTFDFDSEISD